MAQFDLHRNRDGRGYLLDIQSNLLRGLTTRLVIPVLPLTEAPPPAGRLNPLVTIGAAPHSVVTQHLAAVPAAILGETIDNLGKRDTEITAALDLLISGI
jgi:toxin CcdB